jgi:hypothetical protein
MAACELTNDAEEHLEAAFLFADGISKLGRCQLPNIVPLSGPLSTPPNNA